MTCRLIGAKPLSEPMLEYHELDTNELQWNFNRNSYIFIQENLLEKVVCEMVAIWSRPQYVKQLQRVWRFPNLPLTCDDLILDRELQP